jgi:hypothetical protein
MEVDPTKVAPLNNYNNRDEEMHQEDYEETKINPYGFFSDTKSAVTIILFIF